MRKYFTLASFLMCFCTNAQKVGINTPTPTAVLDVNGNAVVRTVNTATIATNYDFLVSDPTSQEIKKVNGNFGSSANTTIAKAAEKEGIALLTLGAFDNWKKINFDTAEINPGNNFSTSNDVYVVPSTGIYEVGYSFRYGTGVTANILGATEIGIFKQVDSNTPDLIDSKGFSGVTLATVPLPVVPDVVVDITITNAEISSIYQLTEGDKISFEVNSPGLALSILEDSAAEFVIKKISN